MKKIKNELLKIIIAFLLVLTLFSHTTIIKADEANSVEGAQNALVSTGTMVMVDQFEGIKVDNEYYTINTGRYKKESPNQSNYYEDGEGNTFAIYTQPTNTIDANASSYYYEDIYSERMLEAASTSFMNTITSQTVEGQSFNGIDEKKIVDVKNNDGDSYPALFWKFSMKFSNTNYFFYVYEIIDKNVMYNMTFCATSYTFLENNNNVDSVLNSFKIKNYQSFDHKGEVSNFVSSFTQNEILSKVVVGLVIAIVIIMIIVVIDMKKVDKEEKELEKEELEKEEQNEAVQEKEE